MFDRDRCESFEEWLLSEHTADEASGIDSWESHLQTCGDCREQWEAHRTLAFALDEKSVPALSPAFQAGLNRKLENATKVRRPLGGWRLATMIGYAGLALLALIGLLRRFPPLIELPDASSPAAMGVALLVVPLSLWLTLMATRLLPPLQRGSERSMAL